MHHIRAGEPKPYRCACGYLNAWGHEFILLSNDPNRDGTVWLDGGSEIALDEFALQMQGRWIDDFDIA